MASFNIHKAIAKGYAAKNQILDFESFIKGSLAPDFSDDKNSTHYGTQTDETKKNLLSHVQAKVNLPAFIATNEINTDFNKGVFYIC